MDNENRVEYIDYLKQIGLIEENNAKVNIVKVRQQANETVQDIKESNWEFE